MGWLGNLITIGSAIAAPFTGGTSLLANLGRGLVDAAPTLAGLGEVAGGASTGAMEERVRQMNYGLTRGQLALDRTGLEQTEQQRSARNEVLAQLFGNLSDLRMEPIPSQRMPIVNIEGGIRPSTLGNREAIQELLRQRVEMPDIDKYIHAGGLETALGVGGMLASGIGAFAPKPASPFTGGPDPRDSPPPPADPKSVLGDLAVYGPAAPRVYGPPAPKPRRPGIQVDPFTGQPL